MNLNDLLPQILEENDYHYFDDLMQKGSYTKTENGICVLRSKKGVLYYLTQIAETSTIAIWSYGPLTNKNKVIDFSSPGSMKEFEMVLHEW